MSLDDYRGGWLVLVVYPADFTFVRPTEMLAFSAAAPQFLAEQASLIGVSATGSTASEREAQRMLKRQLERSLPGGSATVLNRNNSDNRASRRWPSRCSTSTLQERQRRLRP